MRTTVVIPCFNETDTIREIVGAVIGAAGPGAEAIVVDDCSTDGTRAIPKDEIEARTG